MNTVIHLAVQILTSNSTKYISIIRYVQKNVVNNTVLLGIRVINVLFGMHTFPNESFAWLDNHFA
jgi:hypothetical protein